MTITDGSAGAAKVAAEQPRRSHLEPDLATDDDIAAAWANGHIRWHDDIPYWEQETTNE